LKFDRTERRVLGALIEKRWTTPDQYPLSLNALVAACNQKSNRDPVLELHDFEIEGCVLGLREKGFITQHENYGGRVPRFSERMCEQMQYSRHEAAILSELMLRGPQTSGELLRRCERMAHFGSQSELDDVLHELMHRGRAVALPRHSGQRYGRFRHNLAPEGEVQDEGGSDDDSGGSDDTAPPRSAAASSSPSALVRAEELSALRAEVAALTARVKELEDLMK
jgi:uncharacterized protein YceH (UPF0502 family)